MITPSTALTATRKSAAVSTGLAMVESTIDSAIFAIGAFAPLALLSAHQQDLSLPWSAVWQIFWVNVWIKGLVSIASIPFIYLAKDDHLADA